MSFDQKTRNLLQRTVSACRKILDEEFAAQRRGTYGINDDGSVAPLEMLAHLPDEDMQTAKLLRDRLDHLVAGLTAHGKKEADARKESVGRLTRELAFTVLNRLAALRMAEERGIVLECVRHGLQSEGFLLFQQSAGGAFGDSYHSYRAYLFVLFDELAIDLGGLFSRWDPAGLLFPGPEALEAVLRELNGSGSAAARDNLTPDQFNAIWSEDETIGWIYQYYNDPAERKKMRDESAAPRNSREMAVRNQFFTPRYVVEFLTDNSLGRLWYEMTKGKTSLKDRCRYLIRRPNEIFLAEGESDPEVGSGQKAVGREEENLSQEELLNQPVYIPHRPLKDPREIRIIDPACGSMHFGLYAFDLLEVIYAEAWDLCASSPDHCSLLTDHSLAPLTSLYASKEEFMRDVPRMIIEHNIHGVDIDPRATQIAGLSLWLRAQRAWAEQGIPAEQRPVVRRSQIVCAEPMPGEKELLREFVEQEFPLGERAVFLPLLESVFDLMQLAGEAGSLLQIEEDIRSAIAEAKLRWKATPRTEQIALFDEETIPTPEQEEMALDLSGITDEEFWEKAEERIYEALRTFAESAGGGYQRRLFAEDAARGFAFIDLCRQRYDVALMNPPFGDGSLPSKPYIDETYGDTKGDVYKAFVECFQARLVPAGYLGIISSRTGFFLGQSEDWRTRVVLRLFRPIALADLGMGVLDAMVEVAAYVLRSLSVQEATDLTLSLVPVLEKVVRDKQGRFSLPKWQTARDGLKRHQAVAELAHLTAGGFVERCDGEIVRYTLNPKAIKTTSTRRDRGFPAFVCIQALADGDKGCVVLNSIQESNSGSPGGRTFSTDPSRFQTIPGAPFTYWVSERIRQLFLNLHPYEGSGRTVKQGLATADDFRFLRAAWELPAETLAISASSPPSRYWFPLPKGGEFSPFYANIPLRVNWRSDGAELKAWVETLPGTKHWSRRIAAAEFYFMPGLTYPRRLHRLAVMPMPEGSVISVRGSGIYAKQEHLYRVAGLFSSSVFDFLVKCMLGRFGHPQFDNGTLCKTPVPQGFPDNCQALEEPTKRAICLKQERDFADELSSLFLRPAILVTSLHTIVERVRHTGVSAQRALEELDAIQSQIDSIAFDFYDLPDSDRRVVQRAGDFAGADDSIEIDEEQSDDEDTQNQSVQLHSGNLVSYLVGCAFGRWDIRYATGERPAPEPPDPFAALPVCPPGMLQNAARLPAAPGDVPASYPMPITWSGILVDDANHPDDIERRLREVLAVIFHDRTDAITQEACELLGVKSLREWTAKPAGLFADHLKRYSKSRRQAPIYWPLSTASGRYTLWIYYHRLTPDTLFKCIELVQKKIEDDVEPAIHRLRTMIAAEEAGTRERKQLADAESLLTELREFHADLTHWAPRWKPNLNDGVQITASPLWKLFRLPKWQKTLKETWQKLEKGDYDWAHLALTLWPDRVREKCKQDRSLAIAHDLEALCEIQAPVPKKRAAKKAAKKRGKAAEQDDLL